MSEQAATRHSFGEWALWVAIAVLSVVQYDSAVSLSKLKTELKELAAKDSKRGSAEISVDDQKKLFSLLERFSPEAMLSSSEKGYGTVWTKHGPIFVSVSDIKPYADGQKVNLLVRNGTGVSFNGFTLSVEYKLYSKDQISKTDHFNNFLNLGNSTQVEVILGNCKPEDLSMFIVSLQMNTIRDTF